MGIRTRSTARLPDEMDFKLKYVLGLTYHNRIFAGLAIVLLIFIILFKVVRIDAEPKPVAAVSFDEIAVDEVVITRQQTDRAAAPDRPRLPQPEVSDEVIDDIPEFDLSLFHDDGLDFAPAADPAGGAVENPDQPARVRRIVEAITPGEAKELEKRIEIIVTLLVNTQGRVDEVFITEIRVYENNGSFTVLETVGYGLIEETIRAASGWLFQPARKGDEPVSSYSRHRFTFGG